MILINRFTDIYTYAQMDILKFQKFQYHSRDISYRNLKIKIFLSTKSFQNILSLFWLNFRINIRDPIIIPLDAHLVPCIIIHKNQFSKKYRGSQKWGGRKGRDSGQKLVPDGRFYRRSGKEIELRFGAVGVTKGT